MIAVDTNILLYAHREDSPWHKGSLQCLARIGGKKWSIPWPCIHEFLAISTHPRVFDPPSPLSDALCAVETWLQSPSLVLLSESEGYLEVLASLLRDSKVAGPRVHDARIAALCIQHAVSELWSADRDFSRFSGLKTINPLSSLSP